MIHKGSIVRIINFTRDQMLQLRPNEIDLVMKMKFRIHAKSYIEDDIIYLSGFDFMRKDNEQFSLSQLQSCAE